MTGKTKKVLETENSALKNELNNLKLKSENEINNLKLKYETLSEEHNSLKSKCNQEKTTRNTNFKCNKCEKSFGNFRDFKKHKSEHELHNEVFKCCKCDKTFDEDWKMNAHVKSHTDYQCNQCDKSFKYLEILEKHIKITHEDLKIYCHYFNNKKSCPFNEECLFLHKEAKMCKYGKLCERMYCMFKHESETKNVMDDVEETNESVTEVIEEAIVPEDEATKIIDIDDLEDMEYQNDLPNTTFHNPSQEDKPVGAKQFKCKMCDFTSSSKIIINDHKEEIHNWCSTCFSSFSSQENLKNHTKTKHSEKSNLTGLTS